MAVDDEEDESVDVAPGKVLASDKLNFTRPAQAELNANPFASLVRGRQPGKIGDILMKMGRLTLDQLQRGVAAQEKHPDKKLGEVLVDMGFVTPQAVEQALKQQAGQQPAAQQPAANRQQAQQPVAARQQAQPPAKRQQAEPLGTPANALPPITLRPRGLRQWKAENQVRVWDRKLENGKD